MKYRRARKLLMRDEEDNLPPETAPEIIPVRAREFADPDTATRFAHSIAYAVRTISRYTDLGNLDGITVAYDYDTALAELDRGYEPTRPLSRTSDDRVLGVAMAPAVLRGDSVKGHLVFHAPFVLPIEDESHEQVRQALYLIAHECAHIEELKCRDERFPGTILQQPILDHEEVIFAPVVESLWTEYAACRLSAVFGEHQTAVYEECLLGALGAAREEANAAIRTYRMHADINRVLEEAGRPLCEPLRFAAYLLGHLDGRQDDWDAVPQAQNLLGQSPYAPYVDRLATALRELWSTRHSWQSPDVFLALKEIAREVLADGGMIITRLEDDQVYVDIPLTPETMP